MSPSDWGPPVWNLLHTMAAKVKEDKYHTIYLPLYNYVIQICYNLPCEICSNHAKSFLHKIKPHDLKKKSDLINLLYVFHNLVNKLKEKKMYKYEELSIYNHYNLVTVFNQFSKNYNTKGNMKLLASSFHRNRILFDFKSWLLQNMGCFDK